MAETVRRAINILNEVPWASSNPMPTKIENVTTEVDDIELVKKCQAGETEKDTMREPRAAPPKPARLQIP